MSRHPYTYADDYVRHLAGYNETGTILSRSDASRILEGIALAIGLEHEQLATKLSLYYQDHEEEFTNQDVEAFIASTGVR